MCRDKTPWGNQHTQKNGSLSLCNPGSRHSDTKRTPGGSGRGSLALQPAGVTPCPPNHVCRNMSRTLPLHNMDISSAQLRSSCIRHSTHARCMLREATHEVYSYVCVCQPIDLPNGPAWNTDACVTGISLSEGTQHVVLYLKSIDACSVQHILCLRNSSHLPGFGAAHV